MLPFIRLHGCSHATIAVSPSISFNSLPTLPVISSNVHVRSLNAIRAESSRQPFETNHQNTQSKITCHCLPSPCGPMVVTCQRRDRPPDNPIRSSRSAGSLCLPTLAACTADRDSSRGQPACLFEEAPCGDTLEGGELDSWWSTATLRVAVRNRRGVLEESREVGKARSVTLCSCSRWDMLCSSSYLDCRRAAECATTAQTTQVVEGNS